MKKEEMKAKAKEFAQKHEKGLKIAGGAGLVILGSAIGWKACKGFYELYPGNIIVTNKNILKVFDSVVDVYPNGGNIVAGVVDEPLNMTDLGALGKKMMECGCADGQDLTHFIMFGGKIDK